MRLLAQSVRLLAQSVELELSGEVEKSEELELSVRLLAQSVRRVAQSEDLELSEKLELSVRLLEVPGQSVRRVAQSVRRVAQSMEVGLSVESPLGVSAWVGPPNQSKSQLFASSGIESSVEARRLTGHKSSDESCDQK